MAGDLTIPLHEMRVGARSAYRRRKKYETRVRVFGLISVILAAVWCFAAYKVFRYILHMEFYAIMSLAMGSGMGAGAHNTTGAAASNGTQMINPGVVEGAAHIWLVLMYVVGAVVFVGGVKGMTAGPSARRWLLTAAVFVLFGTAFTLLGMWVLIRWGGFPPTVKPLAYVLIAMVQSLYAWVLLPSFIRRPRTAW